MKTKFQVLLTLLHILSISSFAQSTLDVGLAAYFPFNGNTADSSINSNNVSINTATLTSDRFGNSKSAYYFNGNNYMLIPNHPTINFNNKMSICLWMKPMGYYKGRCYNNMLISKGITDGSWGNTGNYSIRFADYVNGCNPNLADTTKEYLYGPTGGVCTNKNIQTNRWYFVVFTTDGVTAKTYINNKLSHIENHPQGMTFTNQHDLRLGMFGDSTYPYFFKGVLDDIRIYNRALDYDEVNLLYNSSPFPTIHGNVFVDVNNNGVKDSTDYFRPNVKIGLSNNSFGITNREGNYELQLDTLGSFTAYPKLPQGVGATPLLYNYLFNSLDTIVTSNYSLSDSTLPKDTAQLNIIPLFNAARPGFDYPVSVSYENTGNQMLYNSILTLPYDTTKLIFVSSSNNQLIHNGSIISTPASNLLPGEYNAFMLNFKLKTTAALGDTLKFNGILNTPSINITDSFETIIRGSYDPNDITANPIKTNTTETQQGKYIKYVIRFENTGTDTAFKVIVTNDISQHLDINSLQIKNLSHPCAVRVDERKLTFTFNNIQLPYTGIDKIGSHGFISFAVKIKNTVADGTDIPSTAAIYFDYNLPVITNTAVTEVRNPIITPLKISDYSIKLSTNKKEVIHFLKTANEVNVLKHNFQKSTDGLEFKTIGELKAKNNVSNEYKFIDSKLGNYSFLYYRVLSVDKNGDINYSPIKIISLNQLESKVNVFPNPAKNNIIITRQNSGKENIQLLDMSGKILQKIVLTSLVQPISIENLSKGIYLLKFEDDNVIKFIKQ
jgi:hypothetical protein